MKLKKICLSSAVIAVLLLSVGCKNSDVEKVENSDSTEIAMNETISEQTNDIEKYKSIIEVKAFFEMAEQAKDKSSIDFVDSIVNMDTSGKLEVLYEDADTILSAPFAKMYTIKTPGASTELIIDAIEHEDDEDTEENNVITSLRLVLRDYNTRIEYNVHSGEYSVTLEKEHPIVEIGTIEKYKEINNLDSRFMRLQEKLQESKEMTIEDISSILDYEFNEETCIVGPIDLPNETANVASAIIEEEEGILNILLKDEKEVYSLECRDGEFVYGFENKNYYVRSDETISKDKYFLTKHVKTKSDVIELLEVMNAPLVPVG